MALYTCAAGLFVAHALKQTRWGLLVAAFSAFHFLAATNLVYPQLMDVGDVSSRTVARWHAGEHLVALGYPARDVDAGFDWIGLHHAGPVDGGATAARRWRAPWPFKSTFPRAGNCAFIDYHPHNESWLRLLGTESYSAGFGLHREKLWLYRNERACAAASLGGVGG